MNKEAAIVQASRDFIAKCEEMEVDMISALGFVQLALSQTDEVVIEMTGEEGNDTLDKLLHAYTQPLRSAGMSSAQIVGLMSFLQVAIATTLMEEAGEDARQDYLDQFGIN